MLNLKISATALGLNYLPEYYARANGLFEAHGVEVSNTPCDPWTGVLDDLETGVADIALGGLWVPAMFAGTRRDFTVFGQLNHQFPMAIVMRKPSHNFALSDLTGLTVLAPGAGGSAPYEFTAGLMREAGVDPSGIRFVRDLSTAMLVELFEDGLGDAIIVDLLTATLLEDNGNGFIVFEHAKAGGIMPNSVYYCQADRLEELAPALARFVGAVEEAMTALAGSTAEDHTALLNAMWPNVPLVSLLTATNRLLESKTWETATVDPTACARWMGILLDAGLVTSAPTYDAMITTRITDAASLPVR